RFIDTKSARVVLLEGGPRVLPTYPPDLSESARRQLEALGGEVRTNALVRHIEPDAVWVGDERIDAGNVYCTAGLAASPVARSLGAQLDRAGRVMVEPDCSVAGHPEVFVIGDLAHLEIDGAQVPGVAQGAIQTGRFVARQIQRDLEGKP